MVTMVAIALWKQIRNCFCQTFVEYMPLKGAYLLGKLVAQPDVLIPPSGRNISAKQFSLVPVVWNLGWLVMAAGILWSS